ncbi:VOC family protein [Saccharophagus sp. K07]|uniref:VOC family protein n=1 Tax=Saccharophagus sp. K07 TaxID=2283636 RepID=UPI002102A15F|nr:VOC family protein [Saccharophagus sp. K07]
MMKVNRIVANIPTANPAAADKFYRDILGLEVAMDHGWIRTYAGLNQMTVQISFASQGGSDTPVPDLSIEVDDLDEALLRMQQAQIPLEYGPVEEPWGVRRFFVQDPFGNLVNVLQHI